jgi:hypothetical protein
MTDQEESAELRCLSAMTNGRSYFFDAVVEHAGSHFQPSQPGRLIADVIPVLRGDSVYDLAQFFYLAEELDLRNPGKFRMLIERHNHDMAELKNTSRMHVIGLNARRLDEAIFSEHQQRKIEDAGLDAHGKVRLDQSDLSKLMAVMMSPESCRQAVVALSEGALLLRRGRGTVFVSSDGTLERYFREHLMRIDRTIRGLEP